MNTKYLLLALVPIILVAACAQAPVSTGGTIPPETGSTDKISVTSEEASILDDQILSITEEQLNAISIEDPTFLTDSQDSIAADTSMFYYE